MSLLKNFVRLVAIAVTALAIGGVTASTAAADDVGATAKLSHGQATTMLSNAGITWSSSGGCSDRNRPNCTSFDQINDTTIQGIITLKNASGCAINVTGGTETGHADGTYSHWNGYKLDTSVSSCLTNYIHNSFASIGGNRWQSASGNIYFYEYNHWDITYYNCGGC